MSDELGSSQPKSQQISFQLEIDGSVRRLALSAGDSAGEWHAMLDGTALHIDARQVQPGVLSMIIEGRAYRCLLDASNQNPAEITIKIGDGHFSFVFVDPRSLVARGSKASSASGLQIVKAPMPGRIARLLVSVGDQVEARQAVVVIEAMKMQSELKAARSGKIVDIRTEAGAAVTGGQPLILIE